MQVDKQMAGEVHVSIEITDTGRGISTEKAPLIFEQYMHESNTAGTLHGAGLGLALVKALVELHHGQITVDSIPGQGSKFTCRLAIACCHCRRQ